MTIFEALQLGRNTLRNHEIDSASLDANLILSHLTNLSKIQLITHDEDELSSEIQDKFSKLIELRTKGYPIAYILGYKEFWGLNLQVNENTLIPRPDTETLVQAALDCKVQGNVLDLGTGSGAIILALKSEYQNDINAYACDFSAGALDVAKSNSKNLNLDVTFIQSNWFEKIANLNIKFSMIVSNPPYIESDDIHLSQSSLPFEPSTALSSGVDGLDDIRIICKESLKYLDTNAPLLLEHGYNQGDAVAKILQDLGYVSVRTIKDLAMQDRVTLGFNPK